MAKQKKHGSNAKKSNFIKRKRAQKRLQAKINHGGSFVRDQTQPYEERLLH